MMSKNKHLVYIGLGSNQQFPLEQIRNAIVEIEDENTSVLATSSLYLTKPWGIEAQPDFINAVILCETTLSAQTLLHRLLAIEQAHGRIRKEKNGPRTLDCDILLYGNEVINEHELTIPHPGITTRAFVLIPLAEIAPNLIIPQQGPIQTFVAQCDKKAVKKLTNSVEELIDE